MIPKEDTHLCKNFPTDQWYLIRSGGQTASTLRGRLGVDLNASRAVRRSQAEFGCLWLEDTMEKEKWTCKFVKLKMDEGLSSCQWEILTLDRFEVKEVIWKICDRSWFLSRSRSKYVILGTAVIRSLFKNNQGISHQSFLVFMKTRFSKRNRDINWF